MNWVDSNTVSTLLGVLAGLLISLWQTGRLEKQNKNSILHALYTELEENLTYVLNLKADGLNGWMAPRALELAAAEIAKGSQVSNELRGVVLSELLMYLLISKDFNQKVITGAYNNVSFNKLFQSDEDLQRLDKAIGKLQNELLKLPALNKMLMSRNRPGSGREE